MFFFYSHQMTNRPLPLVAQAAKIAMEKILESREKAAFQNIAPNLSGRIFSAL